MILLVFAGLFAGGIALAFDGLTAPASSSSPTPVRRKWLSSAEDSLRHAGLEGVSVRSFILTSIAGGLLAAVAAQVILGWPAVSVAAATLGTLAPLSYFGPRRERRRAAMQVGLVEATAQLRAAIQGGLSVQQALVELAHTAPDALRPDLARVVLDLRLKGLVPALDALRNRLADPLADQLVAALILNDRVGGRQVGPVLDRLAQATRASLAVVEEAKARQSQAVISARVVALVPAVALVGLRLIAPNFMSVYDEPLGQLVLVGCVLWVLIGYVAMLWLGRLPETPRVLGPMNADDVGRALAETLNELRPDVVSMAVRTDPRILLWPALFAVGTWLLLSELQAARARKSLVDQFARQEVDRRLRETLEAELAQSLGVSLESTRANGHDERNLFPPVVKRMLRPILADAGWLVRGVLVRFAPGLAGGATLERDPRLVRPTATLGGYFAEKVGAMLLWLIIPPCLAALGGPRTPPVVWVAAAMVGFVLPDLDLRGRLKARRTRLVAELPAVLDQLVIATSAGLSLEQALDHTAASSDGIAADELRRVIAELGLGRWRSLYEALEGLDRRNGMPELSSLVGQLRASFAQGVPVGQVLAAQADALRERRKAEIVEAGGRATVRMVIPIAVFVLPVLVIVILVPAGVQLLQLRG